MGIAVETPARSDVTFYTNDDRLVGARWYASDGVTPVPIDWAVMALQFDLPDDDEWPIDDAGNPVEPVAERHRIDSTTPGDPDGWIDAAGYVNGIALVTVPHGIWAGFGTDAGSWDLVATSAAGLQRCLLRGRFTTEGGIA
jgi:hypothetical protein